MRNVRVRGRLLLVCLAFAASTIVSAYNPSQVIAAQIDNRSLTLAAGANGDGGSMPGGIVNHQFLFTLPNAGTVGSIKFEYCTVASVEACVAPTGMDATAAVFGNETGSSVTGFSKLSSNQNSFIISRAAAAITAGSVVRIQLNNVTNPSQANYTFFVRITTYTGNDGATGQVDFGTVAASTANQIQLEGVMPESLIFCTGQTVSVDCLTVTNGIIYFNQLFSSIDTATATSQMAASTNADSGYVITVNGPTLTSGSNTIPALTAPGASVKGVGQFGMNLKLNTTATSTVAVGAEVDPTPNGTDLRGHAKAGYDAVDQFKFVTGETVAASDFNVPGPTNSQRYTVSYIVNASGNQSPGTYTTTLTYICTPTF